MSREKEYILIQRILEGEEHLYRELVDSHSDNIFYLIFKVLGDRELSEEVAQDVFVKAFFSLNKFRGESTFSTWLYRIAYNLAVSKSRLKKRFFVSVENIKVEDDSYLYDDVALDREVKMDLLDRAIESLGSEERFILLSFYRDEKSVKELAQITSLSESNIKVKLHRARKRLDKIINDNMEVQYGK